MTQKLRRVVFVDRNFSEIRGLTLVRKMSEGLSFEASKNKARNTAGLGREI